MNTTAAVIGVVGFLVGLALSILVIRLGVEPLRRELAGVRMELELRNEAEYGSSETVGRSS